MCTEYASFESRILTGLHQLHRAGFAPGMHCIQLPSMRPHASAAVTKGASITATDDLEEFSAH